MGRAGNTQTIAIVCPSCNDVYDTSNGVREVLQNAGHCVNITCLEDLSSQGLYEYLSLSGSGSRAYDLHSERS